MRERKIILAWGKHPVGTDRAAAATHPALHHGTPLMSLFADPPNLLVAADGNLFWRHRSVFRKVPLDNQVWPLGCQIVLTCPNPFSSAIRASGIRAGTGIERRLPLMAAFTAPPYFFLAAIRHCLRCHGPVFGWMPLPQQNLFSTVFAILIQSLPQLHHLSNTGTEDSFSVLLSCR